MAGKKSAGKKIILFADGTGNSSASPHKTNVWRLYKALDVSRQSNQIAFYDDGVGTSPFKPTALIGLAFGWGLAANVKDLYTHLCRAYEPGDEIYTFGFSRGAFTIRVLTALITSQGIIDCKNEAELDRLVQAAYRRFRRDSFTPSFLSFFGANVRDGILWGRNKLFGLGAYDPAKNIGHCKDRDCLVHNVRPNVFKRFWRFVTSGEKPVASMCKEKEAHSKLIKFIGVWDTVDAYGLPIDEMTRAWDKVIWPLTAKDRELSPRIERACHALALDERRQTFEPMLWNEEGENRSSKPIRKISDERLTQVWFAGVHANVGGGYPDDALAFVSLKWMIDQLDDLKFLDAEITHINNRMDCCGQLYDSRAGGGNIYRYHPRNFKELLNSSKPGLANWFKSFLRGDRFTQNEVKVDMPKIHHTVFDRIESLGHAYAPINIPAEYAVVNAEGDILEVSDPKNSKKILESYVNAKTRKQRQDFVWNKVWLEKVSHLLFLLSAIMFLAYPYFTWLNEKLKEDWLSSSLKPLMGSVSSLLLSVPYYVGKIPGLGPLAEWAREYEKYPFTFVVLFLFTIFLLWFSKRVDAATNCEMRKNWAHLWEGSKIPHEPFSDFRQFWRKFIASDFFEKRIVRTIKIGLETVFVILFFLLAAFPLFNKFVMGTWSAMDDGFCVVTKANETKSFSDGLIKAEVSFDAKQHCNPTGVYLEDGKSYHISIEIDDPEIWKDKTISADLTGWLDAPTVMYLATPYRRHFFAGWYQPMARVGENYSDIYPLENDDEILRHQRAERKCSKETTGEKRSQRKKPTDQKSCMNRILDTSYKKLTKIEAKITANQDGELFLYLNDAVVFHPRLADYLGDTVGGWMNWMNFYENNMGTARVTIKPMK